VCVCMGGRQPATTNGAAQKGAKGRREVGGGRP
jgi:hypothetical protein